MTRFFATLGAAAVFAAAASSQCFEPNFGSLLGTGDDSAFPSTTTANPMNITFPMGGTFAAYTHITANTNGCVFLWNAATGVVGATATGYSTSTTTQLTNLRGAAGGAPRVAPLWRDLNLLAANNGGLWLNNTIPGKCVVTWANAVNFSTTTPIFTVQAQLFDTGEIKFFYNGTVQSSAATITGVSQGGAIAAVAGVNLNPGPNSSTTQLMFEQFAASMVDLQNTGLSFLPNGSGGYDETAAVCQPASNSNYGSGCYNIPGTGYYEFFADAAAASPSLQGNAMLLTPAGAGYTGTWIAGGATAYIAPTGAATALTASDDGVFTVTLGGSFPGPTGPVTQITVASNGVVGLGTLGNNGGDFSPTGPEFAAATGTCFYSWHDFNPAEAGSGLVKLEGVGNLLTITWDGVENYSTPAAVNTSTIQFQLDTVTGTVQIVWVTIDTDITSSFGSAHVVGWKAGGAITDPGSQVLATALPLTTINQVLAMSMSASPTPVSTIGSGTLVTYQINNIAEAAPMSGVYFGVTILSVAQDPGFDLTGLGAPGCFLYVGSIDLPITFVGGTSSQTTQFQVPAGVPGGFQFYAQSAAFIVPNSLPNGQNAFGVVTSNGVASYVNSF